MKLLARLCLFVGAAVPAFAQGPLQTVFGYQGELAVSGLPAEGIFDFRFRVFGSDSGGDQLGATFCADNVAVAGGRFSRDLDFGAVFNGQRRWIEIGVRADTGADCADAAGFTTLSPRHELTATPHALYALQAGTAANAQTLSGQSPAFYTSATNLTSGTLPSGRLSGTYTGTLNLTNVGNTISGNGAGLSNLNAARLTTGTLSDARLSPNVALLSRSQSFAGVQTGTFAGDGAGLVNIDASAISSGFLDSARLDPALIAGVAGDVPGWTYGSQTSCPRPNAMATVGEYLYVVENASALAVYGFSPGQPLARLGTPAPTAGISKLAASGTLLVGVRTDALEVWSVSSPTAPSLTATLPLTGTPLGLAVSGSVAAVLTQSGPVYRLNVVSLADPAAPVLVGSVSTFDRLTGVALDGTLALLLGSDTQPSSGSVPVQVFRITESSAPTLTGSLSLPCLWATAAVVRGGYAYVTAETSPHLYSYQLFTIDLADPAATTVVNAQYAGLYIESIKVVNETLVMLDSRVSSRYHLLMRSIANPALPSGTDFVESPVNSYAYSFAASGSGLYVGVENASNFAIQVWDPGVKTFDRVVRSRSGFAGDGGRLTNLNASQVTTGTISNERLPANVMFRDREETINGRKVFSNPPHFYNLLNGAAPFTVSSPVLVPNLNADRLDGLSSGDFASASHTHAAADITSGVLAPTRIPDLDAAKITIGALSDARLSANVARRSDNQTFSGINIFSNALNSFMGNSFVGGSFSGSGAGLVNLNASNLTSGTVPDGRISSNLPRRDAATNSFSGSMYVHGDDDNSFASLLVERDTANNATLPPLRVRVNNATKLVVDTNGGTVLGVNNTTAPPPNGLRVAGGSVLIGEVSIGSSSPQAVPANGLRVAGGATIIGSLSKGGGSFKIDHPLDPRNKYLYHSFVESPDMKNIYDGNVTTDGAGFATVTLPDWFEALNRDFRYQLTIVDSGENDFVMARVYRKIEGNSFILKTSVPGIEVSWQVTGIRKDAWAERNRIPVEVEKGPEERGTYLHPSAFGVTVPAVAE